MKTLLSRMQWTTAASLLLVVFGTSVHAQSLINNFTTPQDYVANGIIGDTNWDGVYLGFGDIPGGNQGGSGPGSTLAANSTSFSGFLTVQTTGSDWSGAGDDGFFLWKLVAGDFDVSLQSSPVWNAVPNNFAGLLVRAYNTNNSGGPVSFTSTNASENWLALFRFQEFGINEIRQATNAANFENTFPDSNTDTNTTRYFRITRTGDTFTFYWKTNQADAWVLITNAGAGGGYVAASGTVARPDWHGQPVQLGIAQAVFSVPTAPPQSFFTDFELSATNLSFPALPAAPSGLAIAPVNSNSVSLSWTPGTNSAGSLVLVRANGQIISHPIQGYSYGFDTNFPDSTTLLSAGGTHVVYVGTNSSVVVSGLGGSNNTYTAAVFSYSGSGSSTVYNAASPATNSFAGPGQVASVTFTVHSLLKARYPDISYIADYSFLRRDWMKDETSDLEDNHFYNSPQWFMNNVHHYDNRDRKLPPVYDGEVAVTSGDGGRDKGNLIAALAEGAFLLGLERNADVVKMVSYAPLLANVHGRTDWHGMNYFDSLRSYGTVSYYLWKLFGLNRPDYTVQTEVEFVPDAPATITGAIGVGTWNTAAEFKDIRVEKDGQVLYASDFSNGVEGWKTDGGNWSVADGAYRQNDRAVGLSYFGDETWSDYTLTLKARKLSGAEGFLIAFGRKGEDKFWWNIGGWGNREHAIEFNQTSVGRHVPGVVELDRWYDVKVELNRRHIRCYLDGKLVHDETATGTDRFFALAGRDKTSDDLILKAINVSPKSVNSTLNISGLDHLASEASVTLLTSSRLADNNSLDNPTKVVPVASTIAIPGDKFTHEFPSNSLTVMRLKTRHE